MTREQGGELRPSWSLGAVLLLAVGAGVLAYATQLRDGLGATGLSQSVLWGTYIVNLMFFLGVSQGALLVAVGLRLTGEPVPAPATAPILRVAEWLALAALLVGGPQPLMDLGRLDRVGALMRHLDLASPMAWDILAIAAYSIALLAYLCVVMVVDAARARSRGLRLATFVLAVAVAAVAVGGRVALARVPGLAPRPLWDSPLVTPAFLVGAITSGIAAITFVLAVSRRALWRDEAARVVGVARLGGWLIWASLAWAGVLLSEHVWLALDRAPSVAAALRLRLVGAQAPAFWAMAACLISPLALIFARTRTLGAWALVSGLSLAGAWLEKWVLLVPSQTVSHLPNARVAYHPSWVEAGVLAASVAALVLVVALLARLFPPARPTRESQEA